MKHEDELYRKIQNSLSPNNHDYLHPSELPEKNQFEENNFCYEFQVQLLQTYNGVLCEDFVGNLSLFLLENAIHSCYRGCGLAHFILLVEGSAIGIFYDGQKFYLFDSHARDENGRSCLSGTCI